MNIYNFLFKKPILWAATHLFGAKVKPEVNADLDALKATVETTLTQLVSAKVAAIATSTNFTAEQASALITPEATTLVNTAIAKANVGSPYVAVITTYALAQLPSIIDAVCASLSK